MTSVISYVRLADIPVHKYDLWGSVFQLKRILQNEQSERFPTMFKFAIKHNSNAL